jgi:pantoate--beta-alanine ligase
MRMRILKGVDETQHLCAEARRNGRRIGFVPTMGALHEGHLSLVRSARAQCDFVVISIFVNPLQFGPNEDLSRYPRPFERDRQLLETEKVDLLFAPDAPAMYPEGATTFVDVEGLTAVLEGKTRPGHFRGVTTVVTKLFHIVHPDFAFFGQKDAQQATIIRKMARDLDFPIQVVVCPIVREKDGVAMSSRNVYLSPEQRKQATVLYRALSRIQTLADSGERRASALLEAGKQVVAEEPGVRLDYLAVVDTETLQPIDDVSHGALVPIAAYVGSTRLIDNIQLLGVGQAHRLVR